MSFEPAGIFVIPIFFTSFDRNTTGYETITTDSPLSVKIRENRKYLVQFKFEWNFSFLLFRKHSLCYMEVLGLCIKPMFDLALDFKRAFETCVISITSLVTTENLRRIVARLHQNEAGRLVLLHK